MTIDELGPEMIGLVQDLAQFVLFCTFPTALCFIQAWNPAPSAQARLQHSTKPAPYSSGSRWSRRFARTIEVWRRDRDFHAWKCRMQAEGSRMPTQNSNGWSRCFCGEPIPIAYEVHISPFTGGSAHEQTRRETPLRRARSRRAQT